MRIFRRHPRITTLEHQAKVAVAKDRVLDRCDDCPPAANYGQVTSLLSDAPPAEQWAWFVVIRYSDGSVGGGVGRARNRWLAKSALANSAVAADEEFDQRRSRQRQADGAVALSRLPSDEG
jgi:hypothetical protein